MEESTQHVLFLKKTFTFSVLASKKLMLRKFKKLKFLERIFHFLHDILGIPYSFRYSSTSKPVSYHYLVSIVMQIQIVIQIVIQTYNSFGMQRFYHRKEKRNLYVWRCYAFFELFWNFICHPSVVLFKNVYLAALLTLRSSGWILLAWSQSHGYFWPKVLSDHRCPAP